MNRSLGLSLVVVTILGLATPAMAQSRYGYLFAGALRSNSGDGIVAGGGGERIGRSGVSVGGDAAWFKMGAERDFTNDRVFTASLNVGYHFGKRTNDARWNAFASGGPTLFTAVGTGFGFSFGYGANVWLTQRVGIRGEIRTFTPVATDMQPLTSLRLGVTLR